MSVKFINFRLRKTKGRFKRPRHSDRDARREIIRLKREGLLPDFVNREMFAQTRLEAMGIKIDPQLILRREMRRNRHLWKGW